MATSEKYVSLSEVTDFVERTAARGVPRRIAITRAARRFGVERGVLKAWMPRG